MERGSVEVSEIVDHARFGPCALTVSVLDLHQPARRIKPPIDITPKEPEPEPQAPAEDEGPVLDFTGGTHSNTRSGSVSNQAPPEMIQAKVQARAAHHRHHDPREHPNHRRFSA